MDSASIKAILFLVSVPFFIFGLWYLSGKKRMVVPLDRDKYEPHAHFDPGNFSHPFNIYNGTNHDKNHD